MIKNADNRERPGSWATGAIQLLFFYSHFIASPFALRCPWIAANITGALSLTRRQLTPFRAPSGGGHKIRVQLLCPASLILLLLRMVGGFKIHCSARKQADHGWHRISSPMTNAVLGVDRLLRLIK